MMIAYQVGIFLIIIISSFFGFKALITTTICITLFSLSNIFTAYLLVIQFTTIAVASCIGAVISLLRIIITIPEKFKDNEKKYIVNREMGDEDLDFLFNFIGINLLRCIIVAAIVFLLATIEVFNPELSNIIAAIIIIPSIYLIYIVGSKINYKSNSLIKKASFTSFVAACTSIYLGFKVANSIYLSVFY